MKKLSLTVLGLASVAMLAAAPVAGARTTINNPTVAKKAVNYGCQSGKSTRITYGFNRQGLPTSATISVGRHVMVLPYNQAMSNDQETWFGREGGYRVATDYMDSKNYREKNVSVFSPKEEFLFKNCDAR